MASADRVARQESILLPVLIIALGGAIAGGSYGLAIFVSGLGFLLDPPYIADMWFLILLPVFGGSAMGMAMKLALTRAGLRLRRDHMLQLIVIWALGSGTMLAILVLLFGPLASDLTIPITFILPFVGGWLTGQGTNAVIEHALGFRHHRFFLPLIWAAGFEWFFFGCLLFLLVGAAVFVDLGRLVLILTGLLVGGLSAGISGWLMFRELQSALRRRSHMKSRKIHVARANVESSQPSAEG